MGQAGSSQQAWLEEHHLVSDQVASNLDEHIAQQLQEEEFKTKPTQLDYLDERELQIARDAELAFYMDANDGVLPPDFEANDINGELRWKHVHHSQHNEEALAGSLIKPTPQHHSITGESITCAACDDDKQPREVLQAPCGDSYCGGCLERLFRQSMTDEVYFPPRCHTQEILISQAKGLIDPTLAENFEAKYEELSTPDRTYCHDVQCNAFIPPADITADTGRCRLCNKITCTLCKGRTHNGDCPQDTALQQLIATAGQQGWRRCGRCNRMIELTHGCNHMTCICGNQFCYVCGRAPWKTCGCNAFDQQRLLYHAEDIVNQGRDIQNEIDQQQENAQNGQVAPPAIANQGHQARIDLVRQQVAANHEGCDHPKPWSRYQQGEHECWICHRRKGNKAVGWCRRCYFVACYPCRRTAMNRMR